MVFNVATARQYAHEGLVEEWLHAYLNIPEWANTTLSAIIRHEAMRRKGWRTGWVWLWCDREPRFSGIWSTAN